MTDKWRSILILALCEVFALSLWFSATALIPVLKDTYGLSGAQASLFTSSVSVGFVVGTLASAFFGLADRTSPHRFFAVAALIAAGANVAILLFDPLSPAVIALRFVTGLCMAGIYPIGMKMASTWAKGDTGLLVGLLVGALTLGSASPHLLTTLDSGWFDWRQTLVSSSLLALLSAFLIRFVNLGEATAKAPPFNPSLALEAWRNKPLRLANLGYFGHMWELYAMWGWIGLFLSESFKTAGLANAPLYAGLGTFAVIASGGAGSLFGGLFADRLGRTTLTILAMAVSGLCALFVGFLFGGSPTLVMILCLIWGVAVVADSAQFSSCVIELSRKDAIGTMLTVQTSVGFTISLATIHLVPVFVEYMSWQLAFAPLAIGPLLGVIAMARLRAHPDATRLANGNR